MQSIMDTEQGICYLCGRLTDTETHHIFGGANRRVCDEDGLTVELCHLDHYRCHNGKNSPYVRYKLHREGQIRWMEVYGPDLLKDGKDPLSEFMKRYGRNYV